MNTTPLPTNTKRKHQRKQQETTHARTPTRTHAHTHTHTPTVLQLLCCLVAWFILGPTKQLIRHPPAPCQKGLFLFCSCWLCLAILSGISRILRVRGFLTHYGQDRLLVPGPRPWGYRWCHEGMSLHPQPSGFCFRTLVLRTAGLKETVF